MAGIISNAIGRSMAAQLERVNEREDEFDPDDPRNQPARPRGTPMPLAATLGAPPPVTIPLKTVGANVPPQRHADPEQVIEQLKAENARLKSIITSRDLTIETLQAAALTHQEPAARASGTLTPMDAHKRTGISLSMISRYCTTGWWAASKDDTGHWHIDADQELTRKQRPGRRKQ